MHGKKMIILKPLVFLKIVLIVILIKIPSGYGMNQITRFNDEILSNPLAQEDQLKICYFRIEELYDKLKQMKDIEDTLDILQEEIAIRVENKRKQIKQWSDKWNSLGQLLPSERAQYEREALIKQQEFDQLLQRSESELQSKEKDLMLKLTKEIERAAESYAIENGFDFVLSYESGGIYYGSNKYDVTDDLIKIMNDNYKPE